MSSPSPIDRVPDDELMPRIAGGDAGAFAVLYRRRHGDVYRFALHMTASVPIAQDVTQDVFLAVMHDAGRYEPGRATVTAWLCGIARNHVRRRLERDRRLEPFPDEENGGGPDPAVGVQADPLGDLIRAEQVEALRLAILTLPIRYREAVVLCDLQELTYADAAEALACAVGTVRSRLHRGRALLAAKMAAARSAEQVGTGMVSPDRSGTPAGNHAQAQGPRDGALKPGGCFA
jgi:RNA polymerase sigma-70 factor (ECF subfamily)